MKRKIPQEDLSTFATKDCESRRKGRVPGSWVAQVQSWPYFSIKFRSLWPISQTSVFSSMKLHQKYSIQEKATKLLPSSCVTFSNKTFTFLSLLRITTPVSSCHWGGKMVVSHWTRWSERSFQPDSKTWVPRQSGQHCPPIFTISQTPYWLEDFFSP